mgnify:CR=1 FL=1
MKPTEEERLSNFLEFGIIAQIGQFTVTTGATTTTVTHYGLSSNSCVLLMPTDSTTALEYGLGTTYVTPSKGSMVVTHPSNANARVYRYVFFSGLR